MMRQSPERARESIEPVFESSRALPDQDLLVSGAAILEQNSSLGARRVPRPRHLTRPRDRRYGTPTPQYQREHILCHDHVEHTLHVDFELPSPDLAVVV
jgi:hypothetical protein